MLVGMLWLALAAAAFAVKPDEVLPDPGLEARARDISAHLRCLVCQNQSIDDSDADLARDLRVLVRERLTAGDSDDQVRTYIVDRYGEFVLLQPVFAPHTLILWIAAPVLLAIGVGAILVAARRRSTASMDQDLTPEEEAALASLTSPAKSAKAGKPARPA